MIKEFKQSKEVLERVKILFAELEKTSKFSQQSENESQKRIFESQMKSLEKKFSGAVAEFKVFLNRISFSKILDPSELEKELNSFERPESEEKLLTKGGQLFTLKQILPDELENETVKRIKQRRREKEQEARKEKSKDSSYYTKISSRFFSKFSLKLLSKDAFTKMEDHLIKANLSYTPVGYVSIILMTTFLSIFVAGFFFFFFLFFNFTATFPIISRAVESIDVRFMRVFWVLVVIPLSTFLFMYIYPSLEKESTSNSINAELPFATISMAAIAGSMMSPTKIFEILISTNEYPALKKEFTKMINEINVYGYDLVSALKNTSKNSASKRLSELLNGLATTIISGGNLSDFFDERAETLLFNYKIEQEKSSRTAETFMDIYISLLIAAPMILMLLLIIMKLSGLGISMGFLAISLVISLVVTVVNIIFLAFLQMKRSS